MLKIHNLSFLSRSLSSRCAFALSERRYTGQHEWMEIDYDDKILIFAIDFGKTARLGLTKLGLLIVGPLVLCRSPPVGQFIKKDQPFANIVGRHYHAELFCPFDAEIIGTNRNWQKMASIMCQDVEGEDNWMVEISLSDPSLLEKAQSLLTRQQYLERFKEFDAENTENLPNHLTEAH